MLGCYDNWLPFIIPKAAERLLNKRTWPLSIFIFRLARFPLFFSVLVSAINCSILYKYGRDHNCLTEITEIVNVLTSFQEIVSSGNEIPVGSPLRIPAKICFVRISEGFFPGFLFPGWILMGTEEVTSWDHGGIPVVILQRCTNP